MEYFRLDDSGRINDTQERLTSRGFGGGGSDYDPFPPSSRGSAAALLWPVRTPAPPGFKAARARAARSTAGAELSGARRSSPIDDRRRSGAPSPADRQGHLKPGC